MDTAVQKADGRIETDRRILCGAGLASLTPAWFGVDRGRVERGVRAVFSGLTGVLARITTDKGDDGHLAR